MIYVIDHKDSFTHNVVHQLSIFDEVECSDFNEINYSKLHKASTIVTITRARFTKRLSFNN